MSQILSLTGSVYIRDEPAFKRFMAACVPKWRSWLHESQSDLNPVEMAMTEAIGRNLASVHVHDYKKMSQNLPAWIAETSANAAFAQMFGEVF